MDSTQTPGGFKLQDERINVKFSSCLMIGDINFVAQVRSKLDLLSYTDSKSSDQGVTL